MYAAGLDAHLKCVSVAVLDRMGKVALETTVSTKDPERLLGALAPYRPLEVVVETCPLAVAVRRGSNPIRSIGRAVSAAARWWELSTVLRSTNCSQLPASSSAVQSLP
jgi:hypothetical protein